MEILVKNKIEITDIIPEKLDIDRSIYRDFIQSKEKYAWRVTYRFSDLLINSNKNIKNKIEKPLREIYEILDFCIKKNLSFLKSLAPVSIRPYYPSIIKKMCRVCSTFNVGPMAAVAGTVNEYLASFLLKYCDNLIIENGGDLYIKSARDLTIGVYLKNPHFKNKVFIKINLKGKPYGLCSSSSTFGHSLSFGKCDLAVVFARSSMMADAAVTAVANSINRPDDILESINHYKEFSGIKGLLIIKDKKIGIWGNLELVS
jgi:ApbE superfamily uncharacterized protein (UPF0280 family)